jgi:hypothetical protein
MAGATPNYSLPYPEPSDLVANYPALGQDLAEDLDDILATKLDEADQKIIQVVSAVLTTQSSTTSATYIDSGLTASITPTTNTNKILVLSTVSVQVSGAADNSHFLQLVRDSTAICTPYRHGFYSNSGSSFQLDGTISFDYLDSPATTSSTTYKVQHKANVGTSRVSQGNFPSTIILLEVQA